MKDFIGTPVRQVFGLVSHLACFENEDIQVGNPEQEESAQLRGHIASKVFSNHHVISWLVNLVHLCLDVCRNLERERGNNFIEQS